MKTEGIKYTGSKRLILPILLHLLRSLNIRTVFDGFSGTTRVSQAFKQSGYTVCANDIAVWSNVFGHCYLLNTKSSSHYQPMLDHLNTLPGIHGWFTEYYGGEPNGGSSVQSDGKKRMWQIHNTMKLDAVRNEIDRMTNDEVERSVLLTSLVLAMDKVDNTVGHHVSYLKQWAPRSYQTMKMLLPTFTINDKPHRVYQNDIFDLLDDIEVDLAYYDPPYGSSNELMPPSRVRYASYYHIWKTVCLNDQPNVVGSANRREDASDTIAGSVFEEFRKDDNGDYIALDALKRLIERTKAQYIVLSYNNNGRATFDAIVQMVRSFKTPCTAFEMDYKKNVMAGMSWTNEWLNGGNNPEIVNKEFLFLIDKANVSNMSPTTSFNIERINLREPPTLYQDRLTLARRSNVKLDENTHRQKDLLLWEVFAFFVNTFDLISLTVGYRI